MPSTRWCVSRRRPDARHADHPANERLRLRLRLHEMLGRYISRLPTPITGVTGIPYGPVWPLDTPALAPWRSRLLARLTDVRFDYLHVPDPGHGRRPAHRGDGVNSAAILPSRKEAPTITAVTTAVDTALDDTRAVSIHADSSDTPATAARFAATATRAAKVPLTGLTRGKGAQILAATHPPNLADADAVLIADTDTRNPDPDLHATLLEHIRGGTAHWPAPTTRGTGTRPTSPTTSPGH
ncbi:hypothetical protein AB0O01_35450 [Streptomyces sp. NPDC093252]|uniref:hypothetical protein n=1 Tax=Streptomyces sp. NPDC093252 TaxID=3154980 RepID=UPI003442CB10